MRKRTGEDVDSWMRKRTGEDVDSWMRKRTGEDVDSWMYFGGSSGSRLARGHYSNLYTAYIIQDCKLVPL